MTSLRALAALALGVLVLMAAQTRPTLANFIATYWLLGSVLTLRWALANRGRPGSKAAFVAALVGVAAGVLVLVRFVLRMSSRRMRSWVCWAPPPSSPASSDCPERSTMIRSANTLVCGIAWSWRTSTLGAVLILAPGLTRPAAIVVGLWGLVAGAILLQDALTMRRQHRSRG